MDLLCLLSMDNPDIDTSLSLGLGNKRRKFSDLDLPHELIENILYRLPLRSLLRFKSVCKLWAATISHPKFTQIHLRRSKISPCPTYLGSLDESRVLDQFRGKSYRPPHMDDSSYLRRVAIINEEFVDLLNLKYTPRGFSCSELCHCDGLFLLPPIDPPPKKRYTYALWNPSSRSHRVLRFPISPGKLKDRCMSKFGIFYDGLVESYKVLIGDDRNYAVYSCRNKSWGKVKGYKDDSYGKNAGISPGVSFDGSIYWVSFTKLEKGERFYLRYRMCVYDGRDETFKNLVNFDCKADSHSMITSKDGLFFFPHIMPMSKRSEIVMMEKDGDGDGDDDAWKEIKVQLPKLSNRTIPLFWIEENKILFRNFHKSKYLLYDHCQGKFTKIRNNLGVIKRLFPYTENLLVL